MQVTVYVDNANFDLAKGGFDFNGTLIPHQDNQIAIQMPLGLSVPAIHAQTFQHVPMNDGSVRMITYVHVVL